MNIYSMKPGKRYLIGDGCGYDIVTMLRIENDPNFPAPLVWVRFEKEGHEDYLFETADCGFSTYVELVK